MIYAPRAILHVDMDAFFAAVEQLDDPKLRGKPVLVGGDGPRGVVATASYEARPFGCHSAQPMSVAKRLCPHAIVVPGRFERYREISDQLFEIFDAFTPIVQPLSIDEAFLDVTGSERIHGSAIEIARAIKRRVRDELSLTTSVGVAPNKFLAKLASDLEKPDGLTVINADDVDRVLPPLPVTKIWGIGPKTAARLEGMAIRTIGDLRKASDATLSRLLGDDAERCRNLALGRDDREVVTDSEAKQISQENTFGVNIAEPDVVRNELLEQVQHVARRLRKHKLRAGGVTLKIRFGEFKTITRSRTLDEPTDRTDLLWNVTREVFDEWAAKNFVPIRLIGMAARNLSGGGAQLSLFTDPAGEKHERLDKVVDAIVDRFGKTAVRRGLSREGDDRDAAVFGKD
ncbi:MAG: polymerase [Humisphaera sp.]|nr:polymerase [Humisphaera sp.]